MHTTKVGLLFVATTLLILSVNAANDGDSWWIQTTFSDSQCATPNNFVLIPVLPRVQNSDCLDTDAGSLQASCDTTATPSTTYTATQFTDDQCATVAVSAPINSGYCLSGNFSTFYSSTTLACNKATNKVIPSQQVANLNLVAGYGYFSKKGCAPASLNNVELAPIAGAACPAADPNGRTPNQCYAGNPNKIWFCGSISDILTTLQFTIETAPTVAPTTAPTSAPTSAAPTSAAPTSAGDAPTTAPTSVPTSAPTIPQKDSDINTPTNNQTITTQPVSSTATTSAPAVAFLVVFLIGCYFSM